ncbi:hypothetical protein DM01DRAFT_1333963 [Hesseltinella vesiculosa]|uniref:5-nitroimidazole antibiotic resistance protein n=1 Tax=Hesseltinella vesiculosa TaxID=101127 RepID=A0A1X2GP76_9FUNG|nr:hypothetical protein DM01DRAFT_1333963 [Hesseltinella vesiculosa]
MSYQAGPKDINTVHRHKERAHYEHEAVYQVLDKGLMGHVGFCLEDEDGDPESTPVVIPMVYGRRGNTVYLHGYVSGRLVKHLARGKKVCMEVTDLSALVLALTPFNHSVRYETAVVFGRAELVDDEEERAEAFKIITDHLLPGRMDQCRELTKIEKQTTKVVKFDIETASVKRSLDPEPSEEKEDLADKELCASIWTGLVPFRTVAGPAKPAAINSQPVPDNVKDLINRFQ